MSINRRYRTPLCTVAALLWTACSTINCGSSATPTAPSSSGVSGVTLTATSLAVGSTGQGTVTLAAAAASTATVTLASSNPAVAAVPSTVAVPAGSSSATFPITALSSGSAAFTASMNGSSSQSPTLTVIVVKLATLTLSASTVVGGIGVTATVTLTAAAPAGGASVALSGGDPVSVPASILVPAGATSVTFTVSTRAVGGTIPGTVTASYGGVSASATVSVTKPTVATASFGVTGPTETDTCTMASSGTAINCTFNGSTSSAPGNITAYDWSYTIATTFSQTTTGPVLTAPAVNCGFLPPPPLPAGGNQWLPMTVTLKVHDDAGNVSAEVSSGGVRLFPQGACGY